MISYEKDTPYKEQTYKEIKDLMGECPGRVCERVSLFSLPLKKITAKDDERHKA